MRFDCSRVPGERCDDGIKSDSSSRERERERGVRGASRSTRARSYVVEIIEIVARPRQRTRGTRGTRKALSDSCDAATISHPRGNALAEERIPHPSIYDGVYAAAEVRAKCLSVSRSSYCVIKW